VLPAVCCKGEWQMTMLPLTLLAAQLRSRRDALSCSGWYSVRTHVSCYEHLAPYNGIV